MRVDFVGHATLLIRHGGLSLLTDPWWSGPAYRDQWYPYPIPVPDKYDLSKVDAVYISHSHEDHLHAPTLRSLLAAAPDVLAVIPLRADTSMRDYLQRIGFRRIREVPSGSSFELGRAMKLTLYTHVDDSLLAVEAGKEVLLNLNDALHSSKRELIVEYCRVLRARFPKIDYLFCGFGGASFFPNCVHVVGKDDVAVARARERYFLHNFGLISQELSPKFAFPFAAHFVLPDARNWWISETRLQLEAPSETLRTLMPDSSIGFFDLQPGDHVEDGEIVAAAVQSRAPEEVRRTALEHFGPAPERPPLDDAAFQALVDELRARVATRPGNRLDAVLTLTDYPLKALHLQGSRVEPIAPEQAHTLNAQVTVETRSDLVRSAMRSPFGKDLISIGYGGQFHVRSKQDLAASPHDAFLQLLAPSQPRWRQQLRAHPLRTLRYLLGDPSMRYAFSRRLRRNRSAPTLGEQAPYEIRDWVAAPET